MKWLIAGILSAVTIVSVKSAAPALQENPTGHQAMTPADYERWKTELSNWGRWGKDDEIGALNLITPETRKRAAALVQEGFSVSLAQDPMTEKAMDNTSPYEVVMQGMGSDRLGIAYHGYAHTHLDSLAHLYFDGQAYNGYAPKEADVLKAGGHAKNSIHNVKNGIFTRGVLVDVPLLKGVPYLEPGTPIYVEDLEAWERKTGIRVSAGDALIVNTGRWVRRAKLGPWNITREDGKAAGLDPSVLPWLKARDVALLASDRGQGVTPADGSVHDFALVVLGVHLIDNCNLQALSEAAAKRNRWEFLLTVAPLPVRGGTGSPVNPIATF